ncbi:GNAT family N-acetyltransferase [Bacillus niameyensis]|uniref:GNAT family N-acetyltransferase n=1 Tax=Bacillus niameyensis TaxID=1522308 RepID=UPI000781773E|nr:GNAT family N-acetyltransferase [Bacillus niameyensis]
MKSSFTIKNKQLNDVYVMAQAEMEDTDEIILLLRETAEWLSSKGSSQWSGLLTGDDSHDTAGAIERGDVFVCRYRDELAGMAILMRQPSEWDCRLWGEKADFEDQAIYLHRLAIRRKYAKTGLGQAILQWCDSGISFENKQIIRLDCVADNHHLNQFYKANGYSYIGEKGGYSLYERLIK